MCILSFAKVEKVVNPPHRPVVSKRHHELLADPCLSNKANMVPKAKQPIKLTSNVPQGNPDVMIFLISADMEYLNAPPKKLPIPTINIDFNILSIDFRSKDNTKTATQ